MRQYLPVKSNSASSGGTNLNTPKYLVIHSLGLDGMHSARMVDEMHKKRGYIRHERHLRAENGSAGKDYFKHLVYHWYVDKEGRVFRGRFEDEISPHVMGHMSFKSISVCFEGNGDEIGFNTDQVSVLVRIVKRLIKQYPREFLIGGTSRILGHGEIDGEPTTCPGKKVDMNKIRNHIYKHVFSRIRTVNASEFGFRLVSDREEA